MVKLCSIEPWWWELEPPWTLQEMANLTGRLPKWGEVDDKFCLRFEMNYEPSTIPLNLSSAVPLVGFCQKMWGVAETRAILDQFFCMSFTLVGGEGRMFHRCTLCAESGEIGVEGLL